MNDSHIPSQHQHTCIHTCLHTYISTRVLAYLLHIHLYTNGKTYLANYTYLHTYSHTYVNTRVLIYYIYTYILMEKLVWLHTHTYIHPHTHTLTHTYLLPTLICQWKSLYGCLQYYISNNMRLQKSKCGTKDVSIYILTYEVKQNRINMGHYTKFLLSEHFR